MARGSNGIRVAFVAAEAYPFIKVGGLGDVVGGLSVGLASQGFDISVYLPWYRGIAASLIGTQPFQLGGNTHEARIGLIESKGVRFYFVGTEGFGSRPAYGAADEVMAFVRFCLATSKLIDADVVHAHDWQAALLPALAHAGRVKARKSVFTIHNLAYQGFAKAAELAEWTGLTASDLAAEPFAPHHHVSLIRGGLVWADRITTVSPTYAQEIQTPAFGAGLDGLLRQHAGKLSGILNGIDTEVWNPATDPHLAAAYASFANPGKQACVAALEKELGLSGPVLGMVTRVVAQKGVDIVRAALPELLKLGYSIAVLGEGDAAEENALEQCVARWRGRVHYTRGFSEELAHRMYAGSRAILMPSRFEPCGLTQMIAQRYGTIPVARKVGGLFDTIEHGRTGILFEEDTPAALVAGIVRLRLHPDHASMAQAGMSRDWSWAKPASAYARMYEALAGAGG